jgi:cysteine desulfurase/selenocysteine lyase
MNTSLPKQFRAARALFPHTEKAVYFNSASFGPFCTPVKLAINENVELRINAERDDSHDAFSTQDELRSDYAELIGADKREVGIGMNTSFGLNIAAFGLPLNKDDEILVSDVEFPAIVYTWKAAAEARGLKLKFVRSHNGIFDIGELKQSVTQRTRVLSLSWVQFFNGFKNDLTEITSYCKQHGIVFVVDGIQGMGVEPIDVSKLGIDIFTSGCQKWMLSPQGCGFFYLSDEVRDRLTPPFMSWLGADWKLKFTDLFHYDKPLFPSARRFEMGYYAVLNILGMKAAVGIFRELGIRNIQQHNYELIDRLAEYVRSNPYYSVTCSMEAKHRSSIFTFSCKDVRNLYLDILRSKIILVNREGSIRVSVHLFNNEQDIDRLIDVLEKFSRNKRL